MEKKIVRLYNYHNIILNSYIFYIKEQKKMFLIILSSNNLTIQSYSISVNIK